MVSIFFHSYSFTHPPPWPPVRAFVVAVHVVAFATVVIVFRGVYFFALDFTMDPWKTTTPSTTHRVWTKKWNNFSICSNCGMSIELPDYEVENLLCIMCRSLKTIFVMICIRRPCLVPKFFSGIFCGDVLYELAIWNVSSNKVQPILYVLNSNEA